MTTRERQDRLHLLKAQQNRPGISDDDVKNFWRAYCAEHFTEQDARAASEDRIVQHFDER